MDFQDTLYTRPSVHEGRGAENDFSDDEESTYEDEGYDGVNGQWDRDAFDGDGSVWQSAPPSPGPDVPYFFTPMPGEDHCKEVWREVSGLGRGPHRHVDRFVTDEDRSFKRTICTAYGDACDILQSERASYQTARHPPGPAQEIHEHITGYDIVNEEHVTEYTCTTYGPSCWLLQKELERSQASLTVESRNTIKSPADHQESGSGYGALKGDSSYGGADRNDRVANQR